MKRTTIMLPIELKIKAQNAADKIGISLGELIRESIEFYLVKKIEVIKEDPFFSDTSVYKGDVPSDGSIHHDDYLYGDKL